MNDPQTPIEGFAIISSDTHAMVQCDGQPAPFDLRQGQRTCDAIICTLHALHYEPDTDLCPRCRRGIEDTFKGVPGMAPDRMAVIIRMRCAKEGIRLVVQETLDGTPTICVIPEQAPDTFIGAGVRLCTPQLIALLEGEATMRRSAGDTA